MTHQRSPVNQESMQNERWELLQKIDSLLETPTTVLAFIWLGLLILDFTSGLNDLLQLLSYLIWALFILQFVIEVIIAPQRLTYLRHHWLTAIALFLPALRVLRVVSLFRLMGAARAARSVGLLRLVTSLNRSMGAIGRTMGRYGIGYLIALTVAVTFGGAAGMFYFESPAGLLQAGYSDVVQAGGGLQSYGEAVWWTAMMMTTLGSEYWPKTAEGRLLAFLLALYAFAIFGYITATIASHFVRGNIESEPVPIGGAEVEERHLKALREEIVKLRSELADVTTRLERQPEASRSTNGEHNQST